jgi:cysteine desulfurase family protein (TIGR01976 family)
MSTTVTFAGCVRADFPVFERRIAGRPIAFFDGPGGSQIPQPVIDAVADYLTFHNANTGGRFATSEESDAVISAARAAVGDLLNAPPGEVVFGANMTTLTFAISRALGREWGPGDEVIVTELDHLANVAPWRRMAEERGMTVHTVPFDPDTMQLDLAAMERLLSPRTRLVAVGAASNAVGTINDVRRAAALAREAGALSFVDAVHYAPHRLVDVAELGCDFLACSAYKFFGPHVGILWGRGEHLERFTPFKVPPAPNTSPERWETGTLNHEGIAGTAAAVDWIAGLGRDEDARAGDTGPVSPHTPRRRTWIGCWTEWSGSRAGRRAGHDRRRERPPLRGTTSRRSVAWSLANRCACLIRASYREGDGLAQASPSPSCHAAPGGADRITPTTPRS